MSKEYYDRPYVRQDMSDVDKQKHIVDMFIMFNKKAPNNDLMRFILKVLKWLTPNEVKEVCDDIVMNETHSPRPATIRMYAKKLKRAKADSAKEQEPSKYVRECHMCKDMGLVPVLHKDNGVMTNCVCAYGVKNERDFLPTYNDDMPINEAFWSYLLANIKAFDSPAHMIMGGFLDEYKEMIEQSKQYWRINV